MRQIGRSAGIGMIENQQFPMRVLDAGRGGRFSNAQYQRRLPTGHGGLKASVVILVIDPNPEPFVKDIFRG